MSLQRRREPWPADLGDFLQFTLLKENIDTMHAVTVLCNALKVTLRPLFPSLSLPTF